MTTQDTLRVVRELRQQLAIIQDTLEGRLLEETPMPANQHIFDASGSVKDAMFFLGEAIGALSTRQIVDETVEWYKETVKRPDINAIMQRLADS